MAEINRLIKQVADGADPAEVGAQMRDLITATAPDKSGPRGEQVFKRMESGEDDYDNSFHSVTAAWIAGTITDEQHDILKLAVTGEKAKQTGQSKKPDDQGK